MRRSTLVVAAGAALVLTLSACGAKGGTAAPAPAGGDAGNNQPALASPFTDAIQLASASKQGTEKTKSAKFTMEAGAGGQTVKASGAISMEGGNVKLAMTMDTGQGQQMEMRFVDNAMYMKMPPEQLKQMGTTKPWMKISADGDDPISKSFGSVMAKASKESDPTHALEQISKTGKIISADQTTLDGMPVNHYKVELDVAKSLEEFGGSGVDLGKLKGKDIKLPMELWLDKNQLPLQVVVDSGPLLKAVGAPGGTADAKTTM